jgi:hypothetical protein
MVTFYSNITPWCFIPVQLTNFYFLFLLNLFFFCFVLLVIMSAKRRNYTIKNKLDIIRSYQKGVVGKGLPALSREHGISRETLRGWLKKKQELEDALKDQEIETRKVRRLSGGGRKPLLETMEEELFLWIKEKNMKGLRVKDQYIAQKAKNLFNQLKLDGAIDDGIIFSASPGWVSRFKIRKGLVSRRQTSSRSLPAGADDICRNFIQTVHNLIEKHGILPKNIINMDQVPRYFETEPKTTIISKGSREVLMKKGGTSHKRFTATFAITGDGKFLKPHILFSNLKNKPTVHVDALVDVNKTGMWNPEILLQYVRNTLLSRVETSFLRQPVLFIIDSYDCHVKLADSKELEKYNVYVAIVPPNLTNILQPLDVAVNRSFQAYYQTLYDSYIGKAIDDPTLQTKAGNPKVPGYLMVSNWVIEWIATKNSEQIINAFKVCGLLPKEKFALEHLHPPLKALFLPTFDIVIWNELYAAEFVVEENELQIDDVYEPPQWYLPELRGGDSFYMCMARKKYGPDADWKSYKSQLIAFMKQLEELKDIADTEYFDNLQLENSLVTTTEIFAAAKKENGNIELKDAQTGKSSLFEVTNPIMSVLVVQLVDYFGIKMV